MILVLCLMAAIWGIGHYLKVPPARRLALIAILWLAVFAEQFALPPDHPLRQATGGSPQVWLALGVAAGAIAAYALGLSRLRARAAPKPPAPVTSSSFSPSELQRYSRHILLREIGGPGQRRLKDARVLVIGAGGLGAPVLLYLAGAGVGRIGVIDDDTVDSSNLQRQVIHTDAGIGLPKVQSALRAMTALNPFVEVRPYQRRLTTEIAPDLFAEYDLILDGSDNFDTRYLANRVAVETGKPLVAAAITQWEGQIGLYDPARGGPCYECVFPTRPAPGTVPTCAEAGVAAPLPGVLGAMMALEAVKVLTGAGDGLRGRLVIFDGLHGENRTITVKPRADCPVCGQVHRHGFTQASPAP